MKSHGTKIKIGLSSASGGRQDPVVSLSKSRLPLKTTGSAIDTPCPNATIFDLCKTTNDPSFYKKRKARTKDREGSGRGTLGDNNGANHVVDTASAWATATDRTTKKVLGSTAGASQDSVNTTAMGPQVEIVNGKIVLRESSLMVPVHGPVTHEDFEEVEEGIHPTAKYSSFTQHIHSRTWGIEETKQFYEALRQCGTDFSLMQAFFPHRTRKQLKLKFWREEKRHPQLIKTAITTNLPLDLAPFEVHLGTIMEKPKSEGNEERNTKRQKKNGRNTVDLQNDSEEENEDEVKSSISRRIPQINSSLKQPATTSSAVGLVDV